jgi:hypothetical protein
MSLVSDDWLHVRLVPGPGPKWVSPEYPQRVHSAYVVSAVIMTTEYFTYAVARLSWIFEVFGDIFNGH